jgi:hypothetical protein
MALKESVAKFLNPRCAEEFLVNFHFFGGECLKLSLSKLLGIAIILGALFVKVPQIKNILQARSAQGIALSTMVLELVVFLNTIAYSYRHGYPFSTYGEGVFISLQNLVIIYLIFEYGKGAKSGFYGILIVYAVVTCAFLFLPQVVPLSLLVTLQTVNIPINIASRIPQIYQIWADQSAGQLALATWALSFAGTLARIFTTMQETKDSTLLLAYSIAALLNGTICAQILYYGNQQLPSKTTRMKKE